MFETTGILDEEVTKSFRKNIYPPIMKRFMEITILICIFCSILNLFIVKSISYFIFLFIMIFILITLYFYRVNYSYKYVIKRMEETYGKREIKMNVYFDEEGARVSNFESGAKVYIKYKLFTRLVETSNIYVLFTKYNEIIVVFKECLDKSQIDEFPIFIKSKCKIKLYK